MKKIIQSLLILFLLSGCWNYQELNNYAIVTAISIDYEDNHYNLSLLIANKKNEATIISAKGKSIYDALKNANLSSPKEIYINHLSTVIISESTAKLGINNIIDFFLRDSQTQQNFYIIMAKNNTAEDILLTLAPTTEFPSQNIMSSIKTAEKDQGKITDANFNLFVKKIVDKGINPVINSITINNNKIPSTKLDTLGIFKNDSFVDWTTKEESIGINLILNNINGTYFNIPCNNGYIVLSIDNYNIKKEIDKKSINLSIKADGVINEINCSINLKDKNIIEEYEKKVEEEMKEDIEKAIKKAKEAKSDIFGFGNLIYKKYPNYFNSIDNWDQEFINLDINFKTKFTIKNTGAIENSIGE